MRRHCDYRGLAAGDRGAAAAIGNFDGLHLGHQSVLALARAAAAEIGAPFGVITFEPHPRAFFDPDAPPFRIMSAEARAHRLEKLGVEQLYELPFDAALAGLEAEEFISRVLGAALGLRHLVAGADFRFGRGRRGDVAMLRALGPSAGFGVTVAPLVRDAEGDFSSSAIRAALAEGRPEDAARMLGHWHRIEGAVVHGDKRGRDFGFPTANIWLEPLNLPKFGVYAATVDVLTGPHRGRYPAAASLGVRPMFDGKRPNLEAYLLDFSGDLYGAELSVALVSYLRPELRFDGIEGLVAQMWEDVAETRRRLAEAGQPLAAAPLPG
ncbi:bifunctional riboflavin kinase/FAD synthetase [Amaricoccus solimangrovi]|uniref:Riboflavin biosynthesis protein n=1 Tax=Amaricoccus solimangrovi TaxID=2589815 RepID=A0A501WK09_9RHOB|nr:bifunctional riboflavin kinase/FAD synthetase [Amaricoccus solimangrovi]TPE47371.1 bifunctional riboflavin kinase/FAD synthetase [Amaricoccus solimangrovi]